MFSNCNSWRLLQTEQDCGHPTGWSFQEKASHNSGQFLR